MGSAFGGNPAASLGDGPDLGDGFPSGQQQARPQQEKQALRVALTIEVEARVGPAEGRGGLIERPRRQPYLAEMKEIAAEADGRGALVVWGRCLEGDGTPSMWPWVQAVGTILNALPAAARDKWLATGLSRLVDPRDDGSAPISPPPAGTDKSWSLMLPKAMEYSGWLTASPLSRTLRMPLEVMPAHGPVK
ncbi:hypothetical protein AB0H88_03165 [Nonomuraea sp. NPDC050680]|uniref:hypothetical protein n=1 Tax=Nonomuraea sp. NPDC050680 TaxID=3154630 RepID=UPI0033FE63A0